MATIAVTGLKGGVGKTGLAVNLAWVAATRSSRRTLLWDLDGQAAATFILRGSVPEGRFARDLLAADAPPKKLIVATGYERLWLLPADGSLHSLDATFADLDRKKRVQRLVEELERGYDRVVIDCPPGLGLTSDQVLRAADLLVLPLIPSTLSRRAFDEVRARAQARSSKLRVLPVFTLVDRRRAAHRAALAAEPDWPVIPAASIVEQMAERRAPLGSYAPRTACAAAIAGLWIEIERMLAAA